MNGEGNVTYIRNGDFLIHQRERNDVIFGRTEATGDHDIKINKSDSELNMHVFSRSGALDFI